MLERSSDEEYIKHHKSALAVVCKLFKVRKCTVFSNRGPALNCGMATFRFPKCRQKINMEERLSPFS